MSVRGSACLARVVVMIGFWGCVEEPARTAHTDTADIAVAVPQDPPILGTVAADTVRGWTGPGGQPFEVTRRTQGSDAPLHRQIGTKTFALPLRTPAAMLTQYPCASCHQGARVAAERAGDAHGNIQAVHPAQTGATCTTCHVAGAVDRLVLPGGETATLDHAYRVCAQCHFSQVDAWAAGVHGKRLDGWRGRRVVMNCADCHDPHSPRPRPRVPFPGPRIPRTPER